MEKEGIWGVTSDWVVRGWLAENATCKKRSEEQKDRHQKTGDESFPYRKS